MTTSSERSGTAATTASAGQAGQHRHVTGRTPRSVAIVACGPTSSQWHAGNFTYEPQFGAIDEVWTLNKGLRTTRCHVGFVMDDLVGEAARSASYAADLGALEVPIITSIVDDAVRRIFPDNRLYAYPLGPVWTHIGTRMLRARGLPDAEIHGNPEAVLRAGKSLGEYIHNSIPYILAYALFIGVKQIALFGADYTFPGQAAREDDRANCEYWVGALRMAGVDVQVPPQTTLLNKSSGRTLYGYGARIPVLPYPTAADVVRELAAL